MSSNRREFCTTSAFALLSPKFLHGQSLPAGASSSRADVGAIDHERIITAADQYLGMPPISLTSFPAAQSPGNKNDFYSEADAPVVTNASPPRFTAHRDALIAFSVQVAALTAAYVVSNEVRYAEHAAKHLHTWFVDPATRMTPALLYGQMVPGNPNSHFEGILETVHLAEVAQAVSFLAKSAAVSTSDLAGVYAWFAEYLEWLASARIALLARDQKSHHGTSWLLQSTAYARLTPEISTGLRKPPPAALAQPAAPKATPSLTELRHQFRSVTIRAQIAADGSFPHEISSDLPYRNSLFNLDMLAAISDLLSTRFETTWEYELQDGPGMRVAMAHHFPFIANRGAWPYRADSALFTSLPLRQPSLLLAGRAFGRPEYVDLWKTLKPDPSNPILLRTFPIRQPLLWVKRAPALG